MANLNDFTAEFVGVDEAVQQQQGAVYNEPDPFVIPGSSDTSATIESVGINQTSVSSTQTSASPEQDVFNQETAEIEGLIAQQPAFSPSLVSPTTKEPVYTVTSTGVGAIQQPLVNPLHDYDTYTYNLSLHAITVEQFNNLADNPDGYTPLNVLIAGAGKYSSTFRRNTFFEEDFYFEDLNLESIINTTKRSRFSNVFNIEFTIIEPMGFTLIQRLVSACEAGFGQGGVGSPNYLKQPFILQIDFYGSRDGEIGAGLIPNQTKLIPIRLIGMQTTIGVKGTEYRVQAAPYNHNAMDPTRINLPANFSISAAKVADIFNGNSPDTSQVSREVQILNDQIEARRTFNETLGNDPEGAQALLANQGISQPQVTQTLGTNGLAASYNEYYRQLEKRYIGSKHDRIRFQLTPELANSAIYSDGQADVSMAATVATDKTSVEVAGGANKGTITFKAGRINIPAGTNIQSVIEWAVTNSKYMTDQIKGVDVDSRDTGDQQTKDPLKLIKVVPRVRIMEYDRDRDDYQYEITYIIKPFLVNSRVPHAPQGRVKGWCKEYNYIYTGGTSPYTGDNSSNRDVINLQLDFNMLFYTTITAFKEKTKLFQTARNQGEATQGSITTLNIEGSGFPGDSNNGVATNTIPTGDQNPAKPLEDRVARSKTYYTAGNKRINTRSAGDSPRAVAAADIMNNQLLDARGDMINVALTIVGDPHFIKQDDILYNQNLTVNRSQLSPNNSLYTDNGELYVFLNFLSPIDYDESTGLAIPKTNPFSYSLFTGVYKVIKVTSKFQAGRFTQVLDLVRLAISDERRLQDRQIEGVYNAAAEIGRGQGLTFPYGRTPGQRIASAFFSGVALGNFSGLEQTAQNLVQKVFQEKVQPAVIKEVGRLTSDIFGSFGSGTTGVTDFSVFDPEVGDPSLFNTLNNIDLPALNALTDSFGSLNTDVIDNIDFADFDFNASVPDALPDVDFLGQWL